MKLLRSTNQCAALVAIAFALACGNSSTEPSDNNLTRNDHEGTGALIAAHAAASVATALIPAPNSLRRETTASATIPVTVPIDRTTACPASGNVKSTGTMTGDISLGGSGTLAVQLTQTLAACVITVDSRQLSITSDPTLAVTGNYVIVNRVPSNPQTLRVAGRALVQVVGSRAPAVPCNIDVTLSYAPTAFTGTVTGAMCGTTVNKSFSWTP